MISVLSHEIRNPLASIDIQIQLLREQIESTASGPQRDKLLKHTSVISREIRRLLGILNNFLSYSKPDKLIKKKCDIAREIAVLLDLLTPDAVERDIRFTSEVPGNLPDIECDPGKIQQVLLNLVLNSFQAMERGGDIRIRVSHDPERDCLLIILADSGHGILDGDRNLIFEPFHTSKHNGTGLGLPIARRIVQDHGGDIEVLKSDASGTTMQIVLPLKPIDERSD
ncbi:hypothetical protein JXA40_00110 [bacterium]|nr:hypothetical protein [candidate division CSSED10-310 bacterium]